MFPCVTLIFFLPPLGKGPLDQHLPLHPLELMVLRPLHKLMVINIGSLILGDILQYTISASFSFMGGRELTTLSLYCFQLSWL